VLAGAAPAADRQHPVPRAVLGGGMLGPAYADPQPNLHLTVVTVSPDGNALTMRGDWSARCGAQLHPVTASFTAKDVPLSPDGSFVASGAFSVPGGTGTFSVVGVFVSPSSVSGAGSARLTLQSGLAGLTCKTPAVSWEARSGTRLGGRPRPQARQSYYGLTAQALPLVLRVSPNRYRVAQAAIRWHARCNAAAEGLDGIALAPPTPTSTKGRFSVTFSSVDEPAQGLVGLTTATLRGNYGTGNVGGTYESTTRLWDLSSGALLDTCSTGRVSWAARP
jgi:hypothetical protein